MTPANSQDIILIINVFTLQATQLLKTNKKSERNGKHSHSVLYKKKISGHLIQSYMAIEKNILLDNQMPHLTWTCLLNYLTKPQ